MNKKRENEPTSANISTKVERKSDRQLVITRVFNAPPHIVFEAWTKPELFMRWWAPKSLGMTILSCEMDVHAGGGYRLTFAHPASDQPMSFFGKYVEVTPPARLVWTNEESADGAVSTLTLTEKSGKTLLVFHELYPTKQALDNSGGAESAMPEQFAQLDELLVSLGAS